MANPLQSLGDAWMRGWGNVGGAMTDIYEQVAQRRRRPKAKPVTSRTKPQTAERTLRPGPQGQTAGQKRAVIEGIERDYPQR